MMNNPTGRLTQGQFSFLPDLSDAEIALQVDYGLRRGYAWSVEFTDDPHPRNTYWEMYGLPMFDLHDAAGVLLEVNDCRATFPGHYIRLVAFDSTRGVESIAMSFIVQRPADEESGFALVRHEVEGRTLRYTLQRRTASLVKSGVVARPSSDTPTSPAVAGRGAPTAGQDRG
jgi:ribulose-bisphosphate carboxylase small chain